MTNQGNPPEITADAAATVGTAPAQSISGGKSAVEWEASYKALQGTYQKLKESSDKSVAEMTLKLQDALAKFEEVTQTGVSKDSQMGVLRTQVDKLAEQIKTLTTEKDALVKKTNRTQVILTDYPELAAFEAQGLLPNAEGIDELKKLFGNFRDTLTKTVGADVKKKLAGSTPAGTGGTSPATPTEITEDEDYVWSQMMEYAGKDQKKFMEWEKKYDAIHAAKAASKS